MSNDNILTFHGRVGTTVELAREKIGGAGRLSW